MDGKMRDLEMIFGKLAENTGYLIARACDVLQKTEQNIAEALDKQLINRLLTQHDKLRRAGFSKEEAIAAVMDLINRRLETALAEEKRDADCSRN